MMTSAQVRQSFLDFFKKQQHTIVPSSPLMPESPNLLFTNAGMNQFVPYFLGEKKCPYSPGRAADTQKCIRAGGKHNDLDDVGFDTYHHTFFEMLGNWSFGNYFKKESLNWGWELLTKVWGFPRERLYATVYKPDASKGDPASFDQEAYDIWVEIFKREGMDPSVHIKFGGKKDNFWMMGETGPCGPCSEIHVDLTEKGDTKGSLVNSSSSRCIEIWNHVFMEFNATTDGKFVSLPSKNVDTGMGFERVAGIIATTKGFKDFSAEPSNYNCDLFTTLFAEIEKMSGKKYTRSVPTKREGLSAQEQIDVAFRVLADHARCVSCAIADGILPSNEGRNYVIRRILRRAIMYSRKLGLKKGDFSKLSTKVVENLGEVFPELKHQEATINQVISGEEEMFRKTLGRGTIEFRSSVLLAIMNATLPNYEIAVNFPDGKEMGPTVTTGPNVKIKGTKIFDLTNPETAFNKDNCPYGRPRISGSDAFRLYDTYGYPVDLTEVMAQEIGISVDRVGFEKCMNEQKDRARSSQKKTDVIVQSGTAHKTKFVGYDAKNLTNFPAKVSAAEAGKYLVTDASPFYAEMGGQVGDTGWIEYKGQKIAVVDAKFDANGQQLHLVKDLIQIPAGAEVKLTVDTTRRAQIQKHHTATHLLDWALRKHLGNHIRQAGSLVGPNRLRFDFSHFSAIDAATLKKIESDINEKIQENSPVKVYETAFADKPADVVATFGEKYGDTVRVVEAGDFSKELCGGTHTNATGDIGLVKILSESAIAAGTRRIEAVAGAAAVNFVQLQSETLKAAAAELNSTPEELPAKIAQLKEKAAELEKKIKANRTQELQELKAKIISLAQKSSVGMSVKAVVPDCSPDDLKNLSQMILGEIKEGSVVLGSAFEGKVNVIAAGSKSAVSSGFNAGNVIKELTAKLDGKGGGRPEMAMGSGKAVDKLSEAFTR